MTLLTPLPFIGRHAETKLTPQRKHPAVTRIQPSAQRRVPVDGFTGWRNQHEIRRVVLRILRQPVRTQSAHEGVFDRRHIEEWQRRVFVKIRSDETVREMVTV
jgi:hypothetical protein